MSIKPGEVQSALWTIKNDYALADICDNERRGLILSLKKDNSFCKNAFNESELTSLIFFLVEQYFNYISPIEYFPGKPNEQRMSAFPDVLKAKTDKFPLGLSDAQKWSDDYLVVYNEMHHLQEIIFKKVTSMSFDGRYKNYINNTAALRYKNVLNEFNYKDWLNDSYGTFSSLAQHNIKVQGLLRQKQNYNISSRLPNLHVIIWLSIGCFIIGIVVPIFLDIFEYSLPRQWNAAISFGVILLIALITYLLAVDTTSTL